MAEWNTDVERDSSVTLSGPYSIKFLDTTPAADPFVWGPWHPVDPSTATARNRYFVKASLRADSITTGDTFLVEWVLYAKDRTTVITTHTIFAADELDATNTWQTVGSGAAATSSSFWGRIKVTKNNTAFNGWVDRVDVEKAKPSGLALMFDAVSPSTVEQSITAATWEKVEWNTDSASAGIDFDGTNFRYNIASPNKYDVKAHVEFDSPSAGDEIRLRVAVVNPGSSTVYYWGPTLNAGGFSVEGIAVDITVELYPKATVWVEAYHSAGGDIYNPATSDIYHSWFTIDVR